VPQSILSIGYEHVPAEQVPGLKYFFNTLPTHSLIGGVLHVIPVHGSVWFSSANATAEINNTNINTVRNALPIVDSCFYPV
jgi:hypothetical protein